MTPLTPHVLSVCPLYLMEGLKPQLQSCLVWLWWAELCGEPWTLSGLGEKAGMSGSTLKKVLDELSLMGVVFPNGNTKAPYGVNVDFLPVRERVKEPEKKKVAWPDWVFTAMKEWNTGRGGVVGPKEVHNALHLAVSVQGEAAVLAAFRRYARDADRKFDTLKRFPENMGRWTTNKTTRPTPRAFGEE